MTKDTKLTKEVAISILDACGFMFLGEGPNGRIIFRDPQDELDRQFYYSLKTVENLLLFIMDIAQERGLRKGRSEVQLNIRKAIGL